MISYSIFDESYTRAPCDLGSSINIMPKVIFEQLQYPALSQTRMFVQLADSTVRHPEGIVENIYVRIRNCFVLTDFVILNMEGDTGIQLILERPFLRDVKAQIDVRAGKIHFRIGTNNIFFKFQYRTEQKFILHQGHDGTAIWGEPEPQAEEPLVAPTHKRKVKKVWRKVKSSCSSNSPRRHDKW